MSKKMNYMLDQMNEYQLPKWIEDLMIDNRVHPLKNKTGSKPGSRCCRYCGNILDPCNEYPECPECYFQRINGS